jgi:hypothetical protein
MDPLPVLSRQKPRKPDSRDPVDSGHGANDPSGEETGKDRVEGLFGSSGRGTAGE